MAFPLLPAADLDHILAHTPGVWEELRGRRIFITGGTGFFGVWLLESFLHANRKFNLGASAVVLTRDAVAFVKKVPHLAREPALAFHTGDVRNFVFPEGEFPLVIHAATDTSVTVNRENPALVRETVLEGTRRVLALATKAGTRKLLFTSSGAVYGKQPSDLTHVPEDFSSSAEARTVYGEAKWEAEKLCVDASVGGALEVKIARCFAFVGPHLPLDGHFAIGNFIRDALRGGPIQVGGDGTPYRSYLHAADLMIWLWTILVRGPNSRAYNVGSDHAQSIREVAETVKSALAVKNEIKIKEAPLPGASPLRYVPAVDRARAELGLCEWIALNDAIRRTAAWHRLAWESQS